MIKIFTLIFTLVSLLCIGVPEVFAQDAEGKGKISGRVLDEKGIAVGYGTVSLLKVQDSVVVRGSLTNEDGNFSIGNIVPGSYLVAVEGVGRKKVIKGPFKVMSGNEPLVIEDIVLSGDARELNTVQVSGKRPLVERKNGMVVMNIANSTLATGNTALEILSRAPGVTVDNNGNISLRGRGGVSLMIDGKLTYLSAEQLTNLLKTTDGNSIQTIELMSNPSAKYDAAGTGGIINIKLKKNTSYGTNGTVTAGGGYGKDYKTTGGVSVNHRTEHINVFGNYNYVNNQDVQDLSITRSNTSGLEKTYFDQVSRFDEHRKNNSYKAGVDYYINERNILGFVFSGYHNDNQSKAYNKTLIGSQPFRTDSSVIANNPGKSQYRSQSYNLNYKGVLDTSGQELNVDFDYSQFRSTSETVYNNYFYTGSAAGAPGSGSDKSPLIFRNGTPSKIKIWSGKLDYVYPLTAKMKLETGVKSSYVSTDNDFQWENLQDGNYVNDVTRSNRFTYKEQVNAAYANLHREFKSTSVQIGLRTELTHSEGNSLTLQNKVKKNYIDFFPSLAVNQTLSAAHEIGFSYSRRIDRPDYQALNPFIYFSDLYTYNQGNPYLDPQYANSFELSYGYKKTTNITFGYIHTKNVITTTLISDTVNKTLLLKEENLAARDTYSVNLSRPVVITSWWNTTNDATLYYSRFSTPDLMGVPFKNGKLTFMVNTMQTFTLSPTINAELSGNYTTDQVFGTYVAKPIYGVDLGISKSFADKRANIKLAVTDVFNTRKIDVSSAIAQQDYRLYQKDETRIFRATFTYNFGSSIIKAVRSRSNSSDAEKSRVKSGG